jgi:hypothetical protein
MPRISNKFKLPTFSAPQSRDRITHVVEIESYRFLRKHIVTLSPITHIKLDTVVHANSHHFPLLSSIFLLFIHCSLHRTTLHSTMTDETDQISNAASDTAASDSHSGAAVESKIAFASSSSNVVIWAMAKKEVPKLFEYWKAPIITEEDLTAFHGTRGLPGVVLCSTTPLEFRTIDRTVIVCFESHLICGLSLPPRKFLVSILNSLECELVHLNPNAIATLKCFSMLCECWLDIPPDTSLFWYFYYPARYECMVFSGIELTLHHNHQGEYMKTKFRGCWKGAS